MKKIFIGIDNGVSGSIGIITPTETIFTTTPTFVEQDYQKKKSNITRVDTHTLHELISDAVVNFDTSEVCIAIERPMVNPQRFKATVSAVRCLEATLVVLENMELPYLFIDSKQWQRALLPKGVQGSTELKKASLDIGNRLFPQFKEHKHKDRDGILIAEFLRTQY